MAARTASHNAPMSASPQPASIDPRAVEALGGFVRMHPRLFVLTGAGVSTGSGIPDYRDAQGNWKHPRLPVQYRDFLQRPEVRRRYWARSLVGWRRFATAVPGPAHTALAALEAAGHVHQLVTQNVDGLHQRAGSRRVIDLHGRLDAVECQGCGQRLERDVFRAQLGALNPGFVALSGALAPDGDFELDPVDLTGFRVPDCARCGGVLKPAVVFFGENVPAARVERAYARLAEADALLVVGSSLTVYSGYRFAKAAAEQGKPVAAVNLGRTRADALFAFKLQADCGEALDRLVGRLRDRG